jgi:hypothetical protein
MSTAMKRIAIVVFALLVSLFGKQGLSQTTEWDAWADGFAERVFVAYAIHESDDFGLSLDESSRVVAHCSDGGEEALEAFLKMKHVEFKEYAQLDKYAFGDLFDIWQAALPEEVYVALLKQENLRSDTQNNFCNTSEPYCTDSGLNDFPAGVNAGIGETGPSYDCLRTRPNPAWYYMRILDPGDMDIYMYSTPEVDIDFCCWGPFDDPLEPCPRGLTSSKVVSCSYSTNWNETCKIRNAEEGEYYILLITNYSNRVCNIHFSKTDGEATTDCSILPPLVNYDAPVCVGGDLVFTANGLPGSAFHWFMVDGSWTSDEQNPVRHNVTPAMAGTYGCAITNGASQSDTTYLEVEVGENLFYRIDTVACNTMVWDGDSLEESRVYTFSYETLSGCDSIVEINLDINFTPAFNIHGTHWPIGGSETHISVNEYEVRLTQTHASVDTVLWQIDCPNWFVVPHGDKGKQGTLYIYSFLLEPVTLHAWAVNRCDTIHEEFFIQTSYYDVEEDVQDVGFEVVPNPTRGEVSLHFGNLQGRAEVQVYNAMGQQVDAFSMEADGCCPQTFDMRLLPDGLYLVVAKQKGKTWAKRVVLCKE